mmetsp:Transcript_3777/g.8912  ORF Transcript_3777/g.8912 Transcript_3777/m.8912 type:complete len:270 (-) Transcript_3777:963-1772(-)
MFVARSTRSLTPKPVAPPPFSDHTGPAMSTWAHGVLSVTNSLRKRAAVMAPPARGPTLVRSAILDLVSSLYSSEASGMRQTLSPVRLELASKALASSSQELQSPAHLSPSEMMHAPVRVAMSTMASGLGPSSFSAYTSASASVRRPSASVLITSTFFPLEAVRMSPGRIARSETMFSHAATMKSTATPLGFWRPMALAAPRTAALPPMSNFIISIMDPGPALRLYPPESKVRPLPTRETRFSTSPSGLYERWMNLGSPSPGLLPWATPR